LTQNKSGPKASTARSEYIPDPVELDLYPGVDAAVDVEASLPPRKDPLYPLRATQSSVNQKPQHLAAEDLGQSSVVQARDPLEGPRLVHVALCHKEMEMRVEVNRSPEV
jgi:hypothetical protein